MGLVGLGGAPSLGTIVQDFTAEVDQIESVFFSATGMNRVTGFTVPYSPAEDGCLVSLWDAWNRFVRSLCLTSCSGIVEGLSGAQYTPHTARNETDALNHIRASHGGTHIRLVRGEPYWFDASAIADLTSVLGLANATSIIGAITASHIQLGPFTIPSPLEEVRTCRNFVAHKNATTLNEVRLKVGGGFSDLCTLV